MNVGGVTVSLPIVLLIVIQVLFMLILSAYFVSLQKSHRHSQQLLRLDAQKEREKLAKMRSIALSIPLSEKIRPQRLSEVVGQQEGIRALRAALCGAHPQHILLYGPPGVGKTAASRTVMEEAKRSRGTPFRYDAPFVELDGTSARFDERGIADPLIGSVHDPIYQGAGAYGVAGVPHPKAGAVTKAHGGILFIDEIGELHPMQINRMLKVLEDRKVHFESAYYHEHDPNIPSHIHDIFCHGLPADFRLIGATTKRPEDISPAIRSRCLEIFFRPLSDDELVIIAKAALKKVQMSIEDRALMQIIGYVQNGRDCVNSLAMAASLASTQGKQCVTLQEIQFVIASSQREKKILPFLRNDIARIGCVFALMVIGPSQGMVVEVETVAMRSQDPFRPKVTTGGIIEEVEQKDKRQALRTKSEIKTAIDTVLTALQPFINRKTRDYDLHIHLNGSFPVEGASAGLAIALTVYSAIMQKPISPHLAVLGAVSLHGAIGPVAEISTKIRAAKQAGITHLIVPEGNRYDVMGFDESLTIEYVINLEQAIDLMVQEPKVRQRKVISIQCTEK